MANDAADNSTAELPAAPWDGRDAPARNATLTRILVRIAREALQGADLEAMMQGTCACLVAELPVAIASVILLDEAHAYFVHEVWAGEWTLSPLEATGDWPVSRGCAGRCARLGTPQLIADVRVDPDYVAGNDLVRSEYLVPIRHRQRMHGVLNIESTRTDFFDAEACAVFDAVADLVAGAIHFARMANELQQVNHRLEQLSMIDGLTGIANRRCFDRELDMGWRRMAAEGRPLSLLMVDADAFKPLNDACGHLHGDECLRELARICGEFVQGEGDLVARFGGEELVLLLPGRDLAAATAIAEALRVAVETKAMPHPASPVAAHVTVSVGVATALPAVPWPPERLIATADRAMYAAKRRGRNRVCAELANP
ncbi:sensor domain-containing diguanylate cyclase [Thermomonas aquatica]|uniref:diguanylate cyclase n=1 Tax=Thermomonas aquatica TaxID=2202149 RepID=A0A5B7ZSV2_9GAMM|nr:diguanylate cyclase [Thermomonas aquatica]QDA57613.1 diguanylate cyclase [Thermomonas aquatica]